MSVTGLFVEQVRRTAVFVCGQEHMMRRAGRDGKEVSWRARCSQRPLLLIWKTRDSDTQVTKIITGKSVRRQVKSAVGAVSVLRASLGIGDAADGEESAA